MTKYEFRKTKDYADAMEKIKDYKNGFQFTIDYSNIPEKKANGLMVLLSDACEDGLLQSVSIGLSLEGNLVDETYIRL